MSLPEQLQKQVAEAQSIIEQHYGTGEGGGSTAQQGEDALAAPETAVAGDGQAPKVEEVVEPQAAAATPSEDENSDSYRQRWLSLQGQYRAAMSRVQTAEERAAQIEQLFGSLQTQQAHQQPQLNPTAQFLSDKDAADYGADLVDMARRAAREELKDVVGAIQAIQREVAALRGLAPAVNQVVHRQRMSAEQQFFHDLGQMVPDYNEIDVLPQFREWLLTPDPMSGLMRQTYLEDAQRNGDVSRVAAIFNSWKALTGQVAQPSGKSAPTTQQRQTAQSELEKQVAPGRTVAAVPAANTQEVKYTPADITKFYDDVRKGVYKGREQERAQVERDIFLAQREGRIVAQAA